jgi:hypothetical protein
VALPAPAVTPSVLQVPTTVITTTVAPKAAKTARKAPKCEMVSEWRTLEQGTIDTEVLDTHCRTSAVPTWNPGLAL